MPAALWRPRLLPRPADRRLFSWLTEADSLTARCECACRRFRVRLLRQGPGAPLSDQAPSAARSRQRAWVREVLLECDGVPVIFAHTVLPMRPRGCLTRWLAGLGSRSLGSLLFAHPGFDRAPLEYRRLDSRHPLYRRAARASALDPGAAGLWARRSAHRFAGQTVLVTEVFLPSIARLGE